jgi:hypothetical protein
MQNSSNKHLTNYGQDGIKSNQMKKIKIEDFMDKTNLFFSTLPSSLWAILAMWLYLGIPQKIQEK